MTWEDNITFWRAKGLWTNVWGLGGAAPDWSNPRQRVLCGSTVRREQPMNSGA